jgi:hypothetical protein
MRHADQRHTLGKTELPCEDLRRAGHLIETAAIESGGLGGSDQLQALRQFLQYRAGQRPRQRRIIPGGEPCRDVIDIASHAAQRGDHRIDRGARIFGRMLVAGKAFFLIVEDQTRAVRAVDLDQCDARIVRAGRRQSREINRIPAGELFSDMRDPRICKIRPELMKAGFLHRSRGQPSRGAKPGCSKAGVSRTNSFARFQSEDLVDGKS